MAAFAGRAQLSQLRSSSVLTNSVGLKPGSLIARMAFVLSSNCCEMVARIVFAAGTSMSPALLLSPGIGEGGGVVKEEVEPELLDELEVLIVESVSVSESELLSRSGMSSVLVSVCV